MKDTKERLSFLTTSLHWLIAITIIYLLVTGIDYPIIHKSLGSTIIIFILIRIIWRIKNGWPLSLNTSNKVELTLAKVSHWILIIGTLLLPLSGLLISIAGGYGLSIFGVELLPINSLSNNIVEIIPLNKSLENLGHTSHTVISDIMIVIIFLHTAGALKHHFIYKDNTLNRMLNRRPCHKEDKS